jgi:hypothetical protein
MKEGSIMSQKQAFLIIRSYGLTVNKKWGEYRVNYKNGTEDSAFYTDDLEDAVNTAKLMYEGITVKKTIEVDPVLNILVYGEKLKQIRQEFNLSLKNLILGETK